MGPLQKTSTGNRYIITCIHYLSRVEAQALPDKTSQHTADFFYANIVCRHGTPAEVINDQGGKFQGHFQELLNRLCIDHRLTIPTTHRPMALLSASTKPVCVLCAKWDTELPTVLLGFKASVQASTHFTLFLHGQDMQLLMQNIPRMAAPAVGDEDPTAHALVDSLKPLQDVLKQAHANIQLAQQKQMTHHAARQLHRQAVDRSAPGKFLRAGTKDL